MPLTPGQRAYWRNRTGNANLSDADIERLRRGPQGSLQEIPGAATIGGGTRSATPSVQAPAPPPVDPQYDADVGGANRRRDDALGFLDQDERDVRREYGFDDTSDPFNRARMLQRSFEQRARGNTNSYAARGQLYSGALQNMQNETEFQRQQGEHGLRTDYDRALGEIRRRRTGVQAGHEEDINLASSDRIGRAISNPPAASEVQGGELFSAAPAFRPPSTPRRRRPRRRR